MHEYGADKASTQNRQILWKQNHKTFRTSEADNTKDHNQHKLNEKYKERSLESFVNFVIVQLHLFHVVPIECLESHGVSVWIQMKLFVIIFYFFEKVNTSLLSLNWFLKLELHLQVPLFI